MSEDSALDDAPDMAAAELALGLLEGEERAHALRRMLAEHGFAQEVERWRKHLAPLFDLWPAMPPPTNMLRRIEQSIDGPVATPVAAEPAPRRWFWPVTAGLTSVAAAALLAVVVLRPIPIPSPAPRPAAPAPAAVLIASIDPVKAGTPVTAVYDPNSATVRITAAAFADTSRSAELWVIAGDGVPHSLGLLRNSGNSSLAVNPGNRARLAPGATLAVSLEPIGGSPTGLPTGPVVAKGALSRV